ncbi:PREDICTED: protein FAM47E [Lipotes vexillifer]|uniref:Protein FAM47E n=1 Tax=Lipotes vexillifer TaxID=118797 RepID=A0A340X680_LIPVE|nr:PREDICTED: protein FAM47E [Lipotes vexillifer]
MTLILSPKEKSYFLKRPERRGKHTTGGRVGRRGTTADLKRLFAPAARARVSSPPEDVDEYTHSRWETESSVETGLACYPPFSGLDSTWTLGHPAGNCGQAEPVFGEHLGYREDLPSKCFTKHRRRSPRPTSLNSRRWRFVRTRLDDFRKGCPPCGGVITQGPEEGFLPQIYHRAPQPAPKRSQRDMLPREAGLCSTLSPARQARKDFLADVEAHPTPHPSALYPDLEEDMPAEVLEVLDPDRKLEHTWGYCQGIRKRMKEPTKLLKKRSTQVYLGRPKKTPVSHAGQWLYEGKKPSETDLLCNDGPPLHENVRKGVSDFCSWATKFGGLNIDEEFILKQFDIDCQSKPSYNVLHTMRPSQVPLELKERIGLNKLQKPQFSQKLHYEQRLQKPQNPYTPKWVKMRYGAWYLNTKLWKKQRADEPLVDPKVLRKAQDENIKKELWEQEELLADLHGTVAFKDFILSRGYRMPSFLEKMCMRKECKCECNKTSVK